MQRTKKAKKIEKSDVSDIVKKGVLVHYKVTNGWAASAQIKDLKKVSKDISSDVQKIIRVSQDLLLDEDKELLNDIRKIAYSARAWLFDIRNSMPFPIDGFRWIERERVEQVNEKFEQLSSEREEVVNEFIKRFEKAKKNFQKKNPNHYQADKYPTPEKLRNVFSMNWTFRQLVVDEAMKDFSPDIYKQEVEKTKKEIEEMKELTVSYIGMAIIDKVDRLARQCTEDKVNARTINNINKMLDQFENEWDEFVAHKQLRKIFKQMKKYVTKNGADVLKDNDQVRAEVGKKMEGLTKQLENLPDVKLKRALRF